MMVPPPLDDAEKGHSDMACVVFLLDKVQNFPAALDLDDVFCRSALPMWQSPPSDRVVSPADCLLMDPAFPLVANKNGESLCSTPHDEDKGEPVIASPLRSCALRSGVSIISLHLSVK